MITNFDDITYELTDHELELVPAMVNGFKKRTKDNPIKASEIMEKMKPFGLKNQARLRKIVNYIRSSALLPLIGTKSGYYCSFDELDSQILSLEQRANQIMRAVKGLRRCQKEQQY